MNTDIDQLVEEIKKKPKFTDADKHDIILNNILYMLTHNYFFTMDNNKKKSVKNKVLQRVDYNRVTKIDEGLFIILTDDTRKVKLNSGITQSGTKNFETKIQNERIVYIILREEIKTITGKNSSLSSLIRNYPWQKKIVVCETFTQKAADSFEKYNGILMTQSLLMSNLLSHELMPISADVLSPADITQYRHEWNIISENDIQIKKKDPIVKYLGITTGNIYRPINGSPISGFKFSYEAVIP